MSEDIIVEIGDVSAVDVDVTALPEISVEVQSIGQKGADGDGLKEYASLAELDAVSVAEIGVIHDVPAEMFTPTPILPGLVVDAVIETQITHFTGAPLPIRLQFATVVNLGSIAGPATYFRSDLIAGAFGAWGAVPTFPTVPTASTATVLYRNPNSAAWFGLLADTAASQNSIMQRDFYGRTRVAAPFDASDAVNKGYVDARALTSFPDNLSLEGTLTPSIGIFTGVTLNGDPGGRLRVNAPVSVVTWNNAGVQVEQIITLGNGTFSRVYQAGNWSSWMTQVGRTPVPASATAAGQPGMQAVDANYLYVCVALNTWKRTPLSTW